jgi:hypothetical protein
MDTRSKTIAEFCKSKRISRASLYKLVSLGLGPTMFAIPGTRIMRITAQADAEWERRMAELAQSQAAQLERERRHALAVTAGQAAAASPLHISKRGERPAPVTRRGRR